MRKPRVLYIVHEFPQMSQTYIRCELEAIRDQCDVKVIGLTEADLPYQNPMPFLRTDDPAAIRAVIDEFRPDVLHGHWLYQAPTLAYFSGHFANGAMRQIPFTLRAHSFDTLGARPDFLRHIAPVLNSELCLGVWTFPFTRALLEEAGVHGTKIQDCFPVINYRRFHDRAPNGTAVMNVGACLPKKKMEDFIELALRVPSREFNLYAMGYNVADMDRMNAKAGSPVRVVPPIDPDAMPAEYKRHEWLVYTAERGMNTVGWPMAVAEAQAAGVGVCVPNLRPDLRDYVGPAGFLYDSINDVVDIVSKPFPDELRELGFEHARHSDIERHKTGLLDVWRSAGGSSMTPSTARPNIAGFDWGEVGVNWDWAARIHAALANLRACIPQDATYLLVDEGAFAGRLFSAPGRAMPFPNHDGEYWGPPVDDAAAIEELLRLSRADAKYMVFAWPAFWWLDHYREFAKFLRQHARTVYETEDLKVFDLTAIPTNLDALQQERVLI